MTLKNGFGKCSLFVLSGNWIERSKLGLFVFLRKKTLIWSSHCSIGQSCCSMTSKRSIKWFLESSWETKSHACLYPLDKKIKWFYFRSFVVSVLLARFLFRSYENRSKRTMFLVIQGLNKVPSGSQRQVDFLAGQAKTFQAYLPNGQGSKKVTFL